MYSVKKILAVIGVAVVLAGMGAVTVTTQPPITETIYKNLARADIIVIAIDNSGSVKARALLPSEKQYVKQYVQLLKGKQFAVLSFNLSITVEQPPTDDPEAVLAAIDRIQDTKYLTWMNGAIDEACEIIRGAGERGEGALVLSTDGFPTTPDGYTHDPEAAIEATRRAAENFKENCSILAIVGVELEREAEEFLREIASRDPYTGEPLVVNLPPIGANEDFETCDFSRLPWETGGDADWFVTSNEAHSGHCSAQAGNIGDNGRTYLKLTTEAGTSISFWYKVSSESGYDYLRFYIDGNEVDRWSGEIDWSLATYPIHPGTHTFRWEYTKDGSGSDGYDTAWIDDISFGLPVVPPCCPTGLRVPQDYSTIGAAIKAAQPGDCINVGPGTYREELWIDKDITLCGAGADVTTIEGKITIASGAPHIEGFRITGSSSSGIIVNHYTRPTILHNIIENHAYDGITIWSLSEPEISYNTIRYNHRCGVSIDVPERTTVTGTGNEIYDNGQDLCPSEEAFPPGFKKK